MLYILEFMLLDVNLELLPTVKLDLQNVVGRFRRDSTRTPYLIFRSLELCHRCSENAESSFDAKFAGEPPAAWLLLLKQVRNLGLYIN